MRRIASALPALAVLLSACGAAPAPGPPAASHISTTDPAAASTGNTAAASRPASDSDPPAQAAARSLEAMMIGETPSPARAGRPSFSVSGGSASI